MTGLWPTHRLTFSFAIPDARLRDLYIQALAAHEQVCNLAFTEVAPAAAANVEVSEQPIDGPGGELALTEEPVAGITPKTELWSHFDSADLPGLGDAAIYVMFLHEIGHALGREHSPDGVSSVMRAYLDTSLSGLTPYDVGELVSMYGPPAPSASDPTPQVTMSTETTPTVAVPAPAAPAHPILAEIRAVLSHLPGEIEHNVNLPELAQTVEKALAAHSDSTGVLQAVIADASLIFPQAGYLLLAVKFLGILIKLYRATHPAKAAA